MILSKPKQGKKLKNTTLNKYIQNGKKFILHKK